MVGVAMKGWHIAILCLGIIVLATGIVLASVPQTVSPEELQAQQEAAAEWERQQQEAAAEWERNQLEYEKAYEEWEKAYEEWYRRYGEEGVAYQAREAEKRAAEAETRAEELAEQQRWQWLNTKAGDSYLTRLEAIAIAQREAVDNPGWTSSARTASYYTSDITGWDSAYLGEGKWTVDLRVKRESGSVTIYRWSVFEAIFSAVYVGAYQGN
ncbi:hypothetical protein ACFLTL_01130 [Chloroflexota bacterium]